MPRITFLPSGTTVEIRPGQSIFEVGWPADVGIQSACVGKGTCGLCRVVIVEGADGLSPYSEAEDRHLGNLYHITHRRLSCQSIVQEGAGDIVVEVIAKRGSRKKKK